jgi:hypothetical protein
MFSYLIEKTKGLWTRLKQAHKARRPCCFGEIHDRAIDYDTLRRAEMRMPRVNEKKESNTLNEKRRLQLSLHLLIS